MLRLQLVYPIILLLILPLQILRAEQFNIPLVFDYPVLQQIMLKEAFTQPDKTLEYTFDTGGCNGIIFSNPRFKHEAQQILIHTKTEIRLGFTHGKDCSDLTQWHGYSALLIKPQLKKGEALQIFFTAQQIRLFDAQGKRIHNPLLSNALEAQIEPVMKRFKVDLRPTLSEAQGILEVLLPHHSKQAMHSLIDSLQLASLSVAEQGLAINLSVNLQKPPIAKQTEATLSNSELQTFNAQWQQWDAFFTFIIKQLAKQTKSAALHNTLFDILLDTRYQIQAALRHDSDSESAQDPMQALFINSWQKLQPIVHQISLEADNSTILPLFSFMTAGNALQTLEKLGPEFGLEISTDGLRRLARLLNQQNKPVLQYIDAQDPDLLKLFQINTSDNAKPISWNFNFNPITSAYAATNIARLNHWIPKKSELPRYLADIRALILQQVESKGQALSPVHRKIYRQLLLTTAWQESCWRQYVVKDRKLVPLASSTGDVGLFQINERVWRGIYTKNKLRWDIAYNTHAGGDILYRYLTRYAIKKQEDRHQGGPDNLARSTYSTYNGGPSRVARYRNTSGVPPAHQQIDQSFWQKYQQVKQGKEYAVAQCLGAPKLANLKTNKVSAKKAPQTKSPPDHHFTLQLAAFSDKLAARKMRDSIKIPGHYQYFVIKKDQQTLYILTYGNFTTKSAANQAASQFTTIKPWIRDFKSINQAM